MMPLLVIIFGAVNGFAIYLIARYFLGRGLTNYEYFYVLAAIISNLILSAFYVNLMIKVNWLEYFTFVIIFGSGLYSMFKLNKHVLVPTIKLRRRLTDEEKYLLPIDSREKLISVSTYFVSVISSIALFIPW